jgi:hypothetical protein
MRRVRSVIDEVKVLSSVHDGSSKIDQTDLNLQMMSLTTVNDKFSKG